MGAGQSRSAHLLLWIGGVTEACWRLCSDSAMLTIYSPSYVATTSMYSCPCNSFDCLGHLLAMMMTSINLISWKRTCLLIIVSGASLNTSHDTYSFRHRSAAIVLFCAPVWQAVEQRLVRNKHTLDMHSVTLCVTERRWLNSSRIQLSYLDDESLNNAGVHSVASRNATLIWGVQC